MFRVFFKVVVVADLVYDTWEFICGDVSVHIGDVEGGESQIVVVRDICEVIDELGGVSDVKGVW
jgi:hypothetical protein